MTYACSILFFGGRQTTEPPSFVRPRGADEDLQRLCHRRKYGPSDTPPLKLARGCWRLDSRCRAIVAARESSFLPRDSRFNVNHFALSFGLGTEAKCL
jgi:hypothetical protein